MEVNYRELLEKSDTSVVIVLTKPFVTDEIKSNKFGIRI
jgi:hypothetical protein